jgi:carboxylesterase type B
MNLPVVVWIHGYVPTPLWTSVISIYQFTMGGYIEGNASMYNGNDLIREAGGGIVAVVIQYRLGLFGFLAGEKVKEGGALNSGLCTYPGFRKEERQRYNLYNTVDQQAALQWVQKHVSALSVSKVKSICQL